jgi:hypothetical protein
MTSIHPISVLVHTFNDYRHLWPGFLERTDQWCMAWPNRFYFGTDVDDGWRAPAKWETIHSGPGAWSNRLAALLTQIDSEYIFYIQEDHWPFKLTGYWRPYTQPPQPQYLFDLMNENDLWRLQISPINRYYQVYHNGLCFGSNDIYFFHQKSKYLVSHQPSIWKKSFLLECLAPGETPWQNEYEGTLRLNKRDDIKDRIAIYDCNWFDHVCVRGRFNEPPQRFMET